MANTNLPLQPETATRLSFFGPKIKSEVDDELSALGGMTRLVARRSSSSPSVSAPSPPSQHSSPSNLSGEHQVFLPPQTEQLNSTAWHNYTHIQNFNVNINMGGEYYPSSMPVTPDPQDMASLYQLPVHMQQQQQQPQQGLGMDMQQQYFTTSYGTSYSQGNLYAMSQMTASPEINSPHDLQDSWHNFMAQYKQ